MQSTEKINAENRKNQKNLNENVNGNVNFNDNVTKNVTENKNTNDKAGQVRHIDSFKNGLELQEFKVNGGLVIYDEEEE